MYRVRLCWNETVRMMKRVPSTSTDWFDADDERSLALKRLHKEGNDLYGQGSHWIEIIHSEQQPIAGRKSSPHNPVDPLRTNAPKRQQPST